MRLGPVILIVEDEFLLRLDSAATQPTPMRPSLS
jgi:hypothetical protein